VRTTYRSNVDQSEFENGISVTIAPSIVDEGDSWVTMSFKIDKDIAETTVDEIKNLVKRVRTVYED
jgi:hypothetical protein